MLCPLLVALVLALQETDASARERVIDARGRCATLLDPLPGVAGVNYGGTGENYRLLIVVRDRATQVAARERLGGDEFQGIRILWSLAAPAVPSIEIRNVVPPAAPTIASPVAPPVPSTFEPDCDILRDRLGYKPLRRPVGGSSWKSWVPCRVWLRSVEGAGGGHSYLHSKHRPDCHFANGLMSPIYREGFLHPWGLRASDSNWAAQVDQDLQYRFEQPRPMPVKHEPNRASTPTQ